MEPLCDQLFMNERDLHPLEQAARECMEIARQSNNIWVALVAHNCAIRIRKLSSWQPYI